jgi:Ca2+-binding EF-hand superfamily protein
LTGAGAFGVDDFLKVAESVGDHISAAEAEQIIQYADKDGDGVISYDEFLTVMTTSYPKV